MSSDTSQLAASPVASELTLPAAGWRIVRAFAEARWPLLAAATVAAGSLALLLVQAPALLTALYGNADNAATLLLAQAHPAGSVSRLGDHAFFEAWWFMRATAGLPGHLLVWQLAPFAVALLGIAAVAGCARMVAGRAGLVFAAAALLAMSPPLRAVLLVPEARVGLLLHTAALCGALLVIDSAARSGRMSAPWWGLAALALTVFTGVGANDQLLLPAAVVPFVLAAALGWWHDRARASRNLMTFTVAVAAGSLGIAHFIAEAMAGAGVQINHFPVHFVSPGRLGGAIGKTLHLFAVISGGGLHTAAGVLALVALAVACLGLARAAGKLRSVSRGTGTHRRVLYVGFWAAALVLGLASLAATSASLDHGIHDGAQRYLLGAWCAVVALLAAATTTRLRAHLLLAGACLFGVFAFTLNLSSLHQPDEYGPAPATGSAMQRFVLAQGARVGYGGYWDVMPVGLRSGGRLRVVPIVELGATGRWAGHFVAANTSWFTPHAGVRRSFLITDARAEVPYAPHSAPGAFGKPVARRRFGPLTVYVYAHDLALDLHGLTA